MINPGLEHGDGDPRRSASTCDGTHAELVAVPATNVYPLPDELSFEEAAAFPLVFETAYRMLVTKAAAAARASGCCSGGSAAASRRPALAIAKALGARALVTSSSDEKLERARELGADATVNHATGDVAAAVKEATGGRGVDVVVEHVGEATWQTLARSRRARGGRIVVCGATTGPEPAGRACTAIWWKQLTISARRWARTADFEGAYELVASGRAQAGRRLGVPARRGARRARAARGRRAARQDRPANPRLNPLRRVPQLR